MSDKLKEILRLWHSLVDMGRNIAVPSEDMKTVLDHIAELEKFKKYAYAFEPFKTWSESDSASGFPNNPLKEDSQ